jgi:hypothetical protein
LHAQKLLCHFVSSSHFLLRLGGWAAKAAVT